MFSEKWDILDESGLPTGKTTVRGKCILKSGEYHLVVHIWVISREGKILIQRRSEKKKLMPGEWAATGGAAISGEGSFKAASRELFEELGIRSNEDNLRLLTRIKRRNSLLDVWGIMISDSQPLKLQKSEVSEVKWVNREHLEQMIKKGEYHNYGREYFNQVLGCLEKFRTVKA